MPNFFQKFRHSSSHHAATEDKKSSSTPPNSTNQASTASNNQSKTNDAHEKLAKKNSNPSEHNKKPDLQSIFSITIPHIDKKTSSKEETSKNINTSQKNVNQGTNN